MACTSCTQMYPVLKDASGCGGAKWKISDVRIGCCSLLAETFTATTDPDCPNGYISDLVPTDLLQPEPLVAVDIINGDEADETKDFTYDRTTDVGELNYNLILRIKAYNPSHECTLNSWEGQDVCAYYKISGKTGDYVWRRVTGKITAITGGLIAGYDFTINQFNPADTDRPKFVNAGDAATTQALLDSLTTFN